MGTNWIANYHALIACFVSYEEWGTMESIQNIYLATPMQIKHVHITYLVTFTSKAPIL